MGRDLAGCGDLLQAARKIARRLEDPLERFPRAAAYLVGVAISRFPDDALGHARVRRPHRIPIAEVPSLEFLDRDAIRDLPISILTADRQPGVARDLIEAPSQRRTVPIVGVDDHDDPPCRWKPRRLAP